MALLTDLGGRAATHSDGAFMPAQFVTSALQGLSACLCRRKADLKSTVMYCFTRVSGNGGAFIHGATRTTVKLA
jgi:hypothetical protein